MPLSIAIVGAGPIGLETALYARTLGHDVAVFDRSDIAGNVAAWGFVRLFSPWSMNVTGLGRGAAGLGGADFPQDECPTGQELRDRYLLPMADSGLMRDVIHPHTRVVAVGKEDFQKRDAIGKGERGRSAFRLLVRDPHGTERIERASIVLDCSGTYGNARHAGLGGIPAPGETALRHRIRYTIPDLLGVDAAAFAGKHTLLIGAGHSAATALVYLGQLHRLDRGTRVTWAIRRPGPAMQEHADDPLAGRAELVRSMLELTRHVPDWLRFIDHAALESIALDETRAGEPFRATLRAKGESYAVSCDQVVSLVGYGPDASIYEQLQVHQCYATGGPMKLAGALLGASGGDCLTAGAGLTGEVLRNPEPNFFILGAKSFGTSSHFLLRTGHEQIRDAFRLIQGDPELDLYRP